MEPGTLYIVSTPIGNLADLTHRAAETLAKVDFIAAEDTRVTKKLLNHLDIHRPMVSYYEHNARQRGDEILDRIANGESCALCSDAGTPAISDPGEAIVAEAYERGLRVVPIPAASAAVTALSVSGQVTGRFVFEGFLPQNKRTRRQHLDGLLCEQRTIIFYEAPHKLRATLDDLIAAFGPQRSVTVCRELTKLHEEIWKTTLQNAAGRYAETTPKGEFVLVMAGAAPPPEDVPPAMPLEEAAALAGSLAKGQGLSASAAAKAAAAQTGHSKSEIYRAMQQG